MALDHVVPEGKALIDYVLRHDYEYLDRVM